MGGIGFAGAGYSSYRNNRDLLKNRRSPFNMDRMPDKRAHYHRAFKDKYVSKVKLLNIRQRLQAEKRKESVRLFLGLITAAAICLILIILVIRLFT